MDENLLKRLCKEIHDSHGLFFKLLLTKMIRYDDRSYSVSKDVMKYLDQYFMTDYDKLPEDDKDLIEREAKRYINVVNDVKNEDRIGYVIGDDNFPVSISEGEFIHFLHAYDTSAKFFDTFQECMKEIKRLNE